MGILLFGEGASLTRFFFIGLIVVGIIGLKIVSRKVNNFLTKSN